MRTWKKIPIFPMTLLLCVGMMTIPSFAATTSQDGLEIELSTDKEDYTQEDLIEVSLHVKNTNNFALSAVSLESIIPDEYKIADGAENKKRLETLNAGEEIELNITYTKDNASSESETTPVPTNPSDSESTVTPTNKPSDKSEQAKPTVTVTPDVDSKATATNTGDTTNISFWVVLLVIAIIVLVLALIFKKKNSKKFLSLLLVVSITGTMLPITRINVQAALEAKSLECETYVTVDGESVLIKGNVEYSYDINDANYLITFDYNDGTDTVTSQTVKYGEFAIEPEEPTREGYMFSGWYNTEGNYFDFNEAIIQNTKLIASWLEVTEGHSNDFDEIMNSIPDKPSSSGKTTEPMQYLEDSPVTNVTVDYELDNIGNVEVKEVVSDPMLNTAGLVGLPIEIQAYGGKVLNANITFQYDPTKIEGDPSDLAIVWYDEESNIVRLLEDSIVDTENNTVSIATTHFSKYGLVLRQIWNEAWGKSLPPMRTEEAPYYNVILAMDKSGSMGGNKMSQSIQAAQNFVDVLADNDYITVITFNSSARVLVDKVALAPSADDSSSNDVRETVKQQISGIGASGGTDIEEALQLAMSYAENDDQHQSLIVLTSDGQSNVSDQTLEQLKTLGQKVVAVGIGGDTDETLMRKIADLTGGSYLYCDDAADIANAFIDLQNSYIGSTKDTDGDGLPDLVEISGMRDQYGEIYTTDPENADSDNDGISDGNEMGTFIGDVQNTYFARESRPDLYTVKSNEAYLNMPETMSYDFTDDNKLVMSVYVHDVHYRMAPDLLTPMEEDGIPKEYIYSDPLNLKVEVTEIPEDFHLENIETVAEEKQGYSTYYKTTATFSYSQSVEWKTIKWRVTADNCSEWSGYSVNGIMANYIEKEQTVYPENASDDKVTYTKEGEITKAKLLLAQKAKLFLTKFANAANQKNSSLKDDQNSALQNFKAHFSTTPKKAEVPDAVYVALSQAISEAIGASTVDEYDYDQFHNQIASQIRGGIKNLDEEIKVDGTTYSVSGYIFAQYGAHTAGFTVKYPGKTVYLTSSSSMNEISTILADYCTLLAQLNNDVWKNFIANYTADIFGLADIKTVTAAQVNEVLDTGEKIIVALCDKDKADELIEEMGTEAQEQLSDWFFNKYKDFVKKNVPNGDKFVGAADEFEKAYNKLEKYIQRLNQYAELIKNNASEEEQNKRKSDAEKAYDQFYAAYTAFEDLVNAL